MNRPLHIGMALSIGVVFMVAVPARATILYLDRGLPVNSDMRLCRCLSLFVMPRLLNLSRPAC